MNRPRRLASLGIVGLCLALGCGGSEGPRPSGDAAAGSGADLGSTRRAAAPEAGGGDRTGGDADSAATAASGFHLFGWLGPPPEMSNAARFAEMKAVGFDLVLPPEHDRGRVSDNLARLDLAAAHGLQCLVVDARFEGLASAGGDTPASVATLDAITATYREHPGFFGYDLGDEPRERDFAGLATWHAALRARDPAHPAWNNLLGRMAFRTRARWLDHTRAYRDRVQPAVLCNDQYDFLRGRDRGQLVENASGLCAEARAAGLPCWGIVQLVEHGAYRALTAGELKWQVATWLAYGARGIGYFTYWTPAPSREWNFQPAMIDRNGSRTAWFDVVARFNRLVRAAGETLAGTTWRRTTHAGSTPNGAVPFAPGDLVAEVEGRAALGRFTATDGTDYLLVANSDSSSTRSVGIEFRAPRRVTALGETSPSWFEAQAATASRLEVKLAAGSFALLRIEPDPGAMP